MASLPHISATLGACISTNNNINTPCVAQLYNKTHFRTLVAEPTTFSPLALAGQKKPIRELRKLCQKEKWKTWGSDDGSCGVTPEFLSRPSKEDAVRDFYKAFNEKDTQTLDLLLSSHCVYEDLLFYAPHEGKEKVINFLETVMDAMGPNLRIHVDDVKESNHRMATVFWHLEWNEKKIPFTNGCGFFTFEVDEGRLLISKITGVEELPLKPGDLLLKLLKAIRTLFDSHPEAAKVILFQVSDGGIDMHLDFFRRKN